MTLRSGVRAGLASLSVLLVLVPAWSYPRPGRTERVSVGLDGAQPDGGSTRPAVTPDGRFIAFRSDAENLVPGDGNFLGDVFLHDRVTGLTELISVSSEEESANDAASAPSVSADGNLVAFDSQATNLVPDDTNDSADVFVRDRAAGTTERVSVRSDGSETTDFSLGPSISADGRYVAFYAYGDQLVPGDSNSVFDVFVHDRQTGTTELVSVAAGGAPGTANSVDPTISGDGTTVAFWSEAPLVANDTNGSQDIYVRDLVAGLTERVSVGVNGEQGNQDALFHPTISADGHVVAFWSWASNMVPGDTNGVSDVFVRDRGLGATERLSVSSEGTEADLDSALPYVSPDGRYVGFYSYASNLVPQDTNEGADAFVHDRTVGTTERVSVSSSGEEVPPSLGDEGVLTALRVVPTAGGREVAFDSEAGGLVPDDLDVTRDVFVRRRGPALGITELAAARTGGSVRVAGNAVAAGTEVVRAADDPADGRDDLGAEITGAALTARPEAGDVLVHLRVASLPRVRVPLLNLGDADGAGHPAVLYGLEFRVGQVRYEVRALRAAATAASTAYVGLHRCVPDCAEVARLGGGIGTTGDEVTFAVPMSLLGAGPVSELTHLRAFAAVGEASTGAVRHLDELVLPLAELPGVRVALGIAPAGSPQGEVAFDSPAQLRDGRFEAFLSSPGPGPWEVWARACLFDECAASATPLD